MGSVMSPFEFLAERVEWSLIRSNSLPLQIINLFRSCRYGKTPTTTLAALLDQGIRQTSGRPKRDIRCDLLGFHQKLPSMGTHTDASGYHKRSRE